MIDPRSSELVRLDGVSKSFPSTAAGQEPVTVLNGASLSVERGRLVLVEGCSGAGKSTLLGLAGLLWRPTAGTVSFLGREVSRDSAGWRNRLRREHLGFVFQNYQLFEKMPAWESIALPLRVRGLSAGRCRRRADFLMERLGLAGRGDHTTGQLSGGEQQRVAVARAVAASPALVIADEPLSNADPESARLIIDLLEALRAVGTGLLVASHDPLFREIAHRRLVLGVS